MSSSDATLDDIDEAFLARIITMSDAEFFAFMAWLWEEEAVEALQEVTQERT